MLDVCGGTALRFHLYSREAGRAPSTRLRAVSGPVLGPYSLPRLYLTESLLIGPSEKAA